MAAEDAYGYESGNGAIPPWCLVSHRHICEIPHLATHRAIVVRYLSTSDFQSEVGEVFGEIGGELPAKFGRRFRASFAGENRQKHFPP